MTNGRPLVGAAHGPGASTGSGQADADPRLAKYQARTKEAAEYLGRLVKIDPDLFRDMTDGSVTPEHQAWAKQIHAQASEAFWTGRGTIEPQQAERIAIAADTLVEALEDQLRLQRGESPRNLWERIKDMF